MLRDWKMVTMKTRRGLPASGAFDHVESCCCFLRFVRQANYTVLERFSIECHKVPKPM